MKQVFNYLNALAVVAVMLTAVGCSNDNEVTQHEIVEGQSTYINLSFKASALTRADDTQAGTSDESTVNTIDIFIFDTASGSLLTNYRFTPDQMDVSVDGKTYSTTEPLLTSVGERSVYAVVNLPSGWSINSVSDLTETVYKASTATATPAPTNDELAVALTADLATAENFVMTSKTSDAAKNFEYWDGQDINVIPGDNKVSLNVQRAVAKFTMEKGGNLNLEVDGGKISDLLFGLGQVNTATYAVQYIPSAIQDPYYTNKSTTFGYGLSAQNEVVTTWMAVYENGDALEDKGLYAPENTSADINALNKTYVAVRGAFIPTSFMKQNGSNWVQETNTAASATTFYVIRVKPDICYFETESEAEAYFTYLQNAGTIESGLSADAYIAEYKDGYCYYTVYVNSETENYNVYRNEFYQGVITEISGLGDTTPGKHEPTPVVSPVYIKVTINVLDWTLVSNDYTLTPQ